MLQRAMLSSRFCYSGIGQQTEKTKTIAHHGETCNNLLALLLLLLKAQHDGWIWGAASSCHLAGFIAHKQALSFDTRTMNALQPSRRNRRCYSGLPSVTLPMSAILSDATRNTECSCSVTSCPSNKMERQRSLEPKSMVRYENGRMTPVLDSTFVEWLVPSPEGTSRLAVSGGDSTTRDSLGSG